MDPVHDFSTPPPEFAEWRPRPKFQDRRGVNALLFALTIASTTLVGMGHYAGFLSDFTDQPLRLSVGPLIVGGFWYSGTILAILGCHELGHYLACRYYDVDASLPFFIPLPIVLTGTLGAFIHIREQIPSKRTLFDIGIAGPIAGFLVAVPALFLGLTMSHVVPIPANAALIELGEPLLFQGVAALVWGTPPDGYSINMHPMAFAAWFGLLATALNLFPFGQLDGGHISYAALGRASTYLSLATVAASALLIFYSVSWIVWTALMALALWRIGPRHPRTTDEHQPLDPPRLVLAVVALIMLILCFTPAPFGSLSTLKP